MTQHLMRKAEFARRCNVHRSRVSHWIADGHISGAALVGTGRKAMINVPEALRQLRLRLDVDGLLRMGNTNLYPSPAKRTAAAAPAIDLGQEITLFEAAGRRIARALTLAGWPVTEQGAWETLMEGLDKLDEQQLDAAEAAGGAPMMRG